MSNFIEEALSRKKEKSPQMEYMWRVQLPDVQKIDPESQQTNRFGISGFPKSIGGLHDSTKNSAKQAVGQVKGQAMSYARQSAGSLLLGGTLEAPRLNLSTMFTNGITSGEVAPQTDLNHRVTSFDLPFPVSEVKRNLSHGAGWKAAGKNELSQLSFRIMEYEDGATLEYLTNWQGLIQNRDGTHNPPALYKKTIQLIRLSSSGVDLHVSTCIGCHISEISNVNYSYEGTGITQYSVTVSVDDIEHEIIPYEQVLRKIEKAQTEIANVREKSSGNPDSKKWFWDIFTSL